MLSKYNWLRAHEAACQIVQDSYVPNWPFVQFAATPPQGAVQLVVRGEVAALPLKGVIDLAAEAARLAKEMAKADGDISRVDAKLNNANFVARAPVTIGSHNHLGLISWFGL